MQDSRFSDSAPPPPPNAHGNGDLPPPFPSTSEDLHAWSIYRQNLNSDFTDSALGSSEKSPMPYGNFHLRETTMQSILNNPKYGPKSELGANMYTYLKFGLPRVITPGNGHVSKGDGMGPNSSGYDSTDEEIGRSGHNLLSAHSASRHLNQIKNGAALPLRSAKSEDYLTNVLNSQRRGNKNNKKLVSNGKAGRGFSNDIDEAWMRERQLRSAMSEANLISDDSRLRDRAMYRSNGHLQNANPRHELLRNGAFVNRGLTTDEDDLDDDEDLDDEELELELGLSSRQSKMAKAASHMSISSRATHLRNGGGVSYRHEAPMLNDKYFPRDQLPISMVNGFSNGKSGGIDYDGFKFPHLQLRNVTFDRRRGGGTGGVGGERVLDGITMEARGGELVAVMATRAREGTALCDILANNYNTWQMRLYGDISVNGVSVATSRLQDRVAYVRQDNHFSPDMSVRQTMLFHAFLREPGSHARSRDTKGRINALIEDLGLAQVKHTRVKDLTVSERQRLNVACQLLLDTDIVVLDQPTRGMDIFDTFFLVEYLRQWAARGRIVIITLQPPTYEILTMIAKVILISTGRIMYYGKRREMLPYFAFIEYPCPAYKNPSDYYLDLVTLDDLSSEAMMESSQRIDQLAAAFRRRAEPLSEVGPPGILPPKIKRSNFIVQIFGLWIRALIYMYPFNVINWVKTVLMAGVMSVALGGIFMGIRWRYWDRSWQSDPIFEQENVSDRLGFHFVFMIVGIWPIIMSLITDEWRNKRAVTRDVNDRLYSRASYILTKTLYSIPSCGGIFLAYIIPGYLLAGIHYPDVKDLDIFYYYIGYMLLYLFTLRVTSLAYTYLCNSRHLAASLTGLTVTLFSLVAGFVIHVDQLGFWVDWLRFVSPTYWMSHPIAQGELEPVNILRCTSNPVITENSIIKQVPCGLPSGAEAVRYFGFLPKFQGTSEFAEFSPFFITAAVFLFFQLLAIIFFVGKVQKTKMSRSRKNKM